MSGITIETLGAIERRFNISLNLAEIEGQTQGRLKDIARDVTMPGFRRGKVPMKMVAAQYAPSVKSELIQEGIGKQFEAVCKVHSLNVAGMPNIEMKKLAEGEVANDKQMDFTATFDIFPEVKLGDLSALAVEKVSATVGEENVDSTLDILRKQRVSYVDETTGRASQKDDRVTVDFVGTIAGVEFDGGKATDFPFVLGGGQMLAEFDTAAHGLKAGESKVFPMKFPDDYQGKDVAGKDAEFTITVKKIEAANLPALDGEFAKTLGVADGDLTKMRSDVRGNLEREVKARLKQRSKTAVMDAIYSTIKVDVPKALVNNDVQRLMEQAREDMKQRGMRQEMPLPPEIFTEQAKRRVSLGLILQEMVKSNGLEAKPEQVRAMVDEYAQSYEDPREVVRWYYSDNQRLEDLKSVVLEDNVVDFVMAKAKVTEKALSFDELMGKQ